MSATIKGPLQKGALCMDARTGPALACRPTTQHRLPVRQISASATDPERAADEPRRRGRPGPPPGPRGPNNRENLGYILGNAGIQGTLCLLVSMIFNVHPLDSLFSVPSWDQWPWLLALSAPIIAFDAVSVLIPWGPGQVAPEVTIIPPPRGPNKGPMQAAQDRLMRASSSAARSGEGDRDGAASAANRMERLRASARRATEQGKSPIPAEVWLAWAQLLPHPKPTPRAATPYRLDVTPATNGAPVSLAWRVLLHKITDTQAAPNTSALATSSAAESATPAATAAVAAAPEGVQATISLLESVLGETAAASAQAALANECQSQKLSGAPSSTSDAASAAANGTPPTAASADEKARDDKAKSRVLMELLQVLQARQEERAAMPKYAHWLTAYQELRGLSPELRKLWGSSINWGLLSLEVVLLQLVDVLKLAVAYTCLLGWSQDRLFEAGLPDAIYLSTGIDVPGNVTAAVMTVGWIASYPFANALIFNVQDRLERATKGDLEVLMINKKTGESTKGTDSALPAEVQNMATQHRQQAVQRAANKAAHARWVAASRDSLALLTGLVKFGACGVWGAVLYTSLVERAVYVGCWTACARRMRAERKSVRSLMKRAMGNVERVTGKGSLLARAEAELSVGLDSMDDSASPKSEHQTAKSSGTGDDKQATPEDRKSESEGDSSRH